MTAIMTPMRSDYYRRAELGMVTHTSNPSTQDVEAGRLWVWVQPGLLRDLQHPNSRLLVSKNVRPSLVTHHSSSPGHEHSIPQMRNSTDAEGESPVPPEQLVRLRTLDRTSFPPFLVSPVPYWGFLETSAPMSLSSFERTLSKGTPTHHLQRDQCSPNNGPLRYQQPKVFCTVFVF